MNATHNLTEARWHKVCQEEDLVAHSGVAVLIQPASGVPQSVALFWLPGQQPALYALAHLDPLIGVEVLAHGLLCESGGVWSVASPLYKQHFQLKDGRCLEQPDTCLQTWPVKLEEGQVWLYF
ncbi:nitrite reductase small subunit NirD [Marinospirillum alkaliphilum]|uniref:Nitrite reductase (NADH) small subunit n=1 Tax=Marinospirillum alkaliphilum DSM 21637 TaxID=1122209 RepID=A0A1K1W3N3_9GAMM|nr:nitrite reductase small subunit NirD [Marinospirillum alkaliphilum]SFX32033.1 nitrite reductase (NADH) small subunit [Marinospirillum alkaliphilum DSM 21637]